MEPLCSRVDTDCTHYTCWTLQHAIEVVWWVHSIESGYSRTVVGTAVKGGFSCKGDLYNGATAPGFRLRKLAVVTTSYSCFP